jgi:hypothetical protein
VKTSVRTTRSGTVRYPQLAHNEWDAGAQRSRTRVLHNFGREDEIDKEQVRRLVSALSRLLDPAEALAASQPGELSVSTSRPLGGTHALDALWRRLGLDAVAARSLAARPGRGRKPDPDAERVLFALVANRALAASSKLACAEWVREDVHVTGLDDTSDDACYRVMDRLLEIEPVLAEQAYHQVTDLLNLEVDLLFFDTTSTYLATEDADEDIPRNARGEPVPPDSRDKAGETGFRTHGKSKDSRDDLPQVIVGMAVTRDGIPVRVQLEDLIKDTDSLSAGERGKIEGSLAARPGLKRFLRVTPAGLLRLDKAKISAEENLDGKYLLRCSDPHMTTEDIAPGYTQLLEVERGWKDMKQVIDLRPVYHRREDRIRAHVIPCWLALLLMRVAENETGRPWNRIRADLQRQHAVTWTGPAGTFRQATDPAKPQRDIYTALSIEPPKKILALEPGTPAP